MANATVIIVNPVPPSLPVAPTEYARTYQDQLNNILRLYFNKLSSALAALLDTSGAQYLSIPCGDRKSTRLNSSHT